MLLKTVNRQTLFAALLPSPAARPVFLRAVHIPRPAQPRPPRHIRQTSQEATESPVTSTDTTPSANNSARYPQLLAADPLNMEGIFAVSKPSGPSSAEAVAALKAALNRSPYVENSEAWARAHGIKLKKGGNKGGKKRWWDKKKDAKAGGLEALKVGHGGTLDPLAAGVMVIGVGEGTRRLTTYLTDCTKVYEASAVFGAATTTYDVTGSVLEYAPTAGVTPETLQAAIAAQFSGAITQYPPVYSALKMDGKPLYEYAREGVALPRKIDARAATVDLFELVPGTFESVPAASTKLYDADNKNTDDSSTTLVLPAGAASDEEKEFYLRETMPPVAADPGLSAAPAPAAYVRARLRFCVSSGTYIRSLIHDVARALGSAAYMETLVRVRQGPFELGKNVFALEDLIEKVSDGVWVPRVKVMLREGPEITLKEIEERELEQKEEEKEEKEEEKEEKEEEKKDQAEEKEEKQDQGTEEKKPETQEPEQTQPEESKKKPLEDEDASTEPPSKKPKIDEN